MQCQENLVRFKNSAALSALVLLFAVHALRGADLTVDGQVPNPQSLSIADLKQACAASVKSIDYTNRSGKHHANAVPIQALLELAGLETALAPAPNVAAADKHPSLRMACLVRGSDGYAVVFSVAELLPAVGNRAAWVAFDQDDQPFPAVEGPLKLIVPDDAGPARSVRGVTEIQVINLAAPITQPAK